MSGRGHNGWRIRFDFGILVTRFWQFCLLACSQSLQNFCAQHCWISRLQSFSISTINLTLCTSSCASSSLCCWVRRGSCSLVHLSLDRFLKGIKTLSRVRLDLRYVSGVEMGVEIGIATTTLLVIYRASNPRFVVLGQVRAYFCCHTIRGIHSIFFLFSFFFLSRSWMAGPTSFATLHALQIPLASMACS